MIIWCAIASRVNTPKKKIYILHPAKLSLWLKHFFLLMLFQFGLNQCIQYFGIHFFQVKCWWNYFLFNLIPAPGLWMKKRRRKKKREQIQMSMSMAVTLKHLLVFRFLLFLLRTFLLRRIQCSHFLIRLLPFVLLLACVLYIANSAHAKFYSNSPELYNYSVHGLVD